ncbi:MAG TPA: SBBP repeat-containing protein, partial [Thermoanaerobaculia bacterium]
PRAVAADSRGSSWVVGDGRGSSGFRKNAEQLEPGHRFPVLANPPVGDPLEAFVAKVRYTLNGAKGTYDGVIEYASHLGGAGDDSAAGVAVDGDDFAYIVGTTSSVDFPRSQNALQSNSAGSSDVFIRKTSGDIDQDAVPDSWEAPGEGIDIDRDGEIEIDLAALGASPHRKDLFLELDYYVKNTPGSPIHSHSPGTRPDGLPLSNLSAGQMPLERLIAAFDAAPVPAPLWCIGCIKGIALHIRGANPDMTDDAIAETPANVKITHVAGDGGIDPDAIKRGATCMTGKFLMAADRLDEETCVKRRDAWLQVAHYGIFGHYYGHTTGATGRGERYGNDFIVATPIGGDNDRDRDLAAYATSPAFGSKDRAWSDLQVYPLMHELGHNLGLAHGGSDGINCKPNYLSVMNYSFTYPMAVNTGKKTPYGWKFEYPRRKLDYSHKALVTLDEAELDEQKGVDAQTGVDAQKNVGGSSGWDVVFHAQYPAPDRSGLGAFLFMAPADGKIDWSDGGNSYSTDLIPSDVNYVGAPCDATMPELLVGHDDWSNLFYDFRINPDRTNTFFALNYIDEVEPTQEDVSLARVIGPHIVAFPFSHHCGQTPASVTVEADVIDADGNVTAVELFVNDVKVAH